ncbi:MAG: HMA2 domain-containing protein [Chloroflexota bacterium]|jgi:hypothetical protein
MSDKRSVTLVSAVPGRIRVRVDRSMRSPESMRELAELLRGFNGVCEVQVNPTTGSFLVFYDPETMDLTQLFIAAQAAKIDIVLPGTGSEGATQGDLSDVAKAVNSHFGQLDRMVSGFTGGKLDAKTLAPLAIGAVAVRQLFVQGAGLSSVPWYVLLWYSFEMFTKYNLKKGPQAQPPPESA